MTISQTLRAYTMIALLLTAAADADTPPPPPAPGFSLTIYSSADPASFDPRAYVQQQTLNAYYAIQNPLPGYGVVRENREIPLAEGDDIVRYTDVATGIDPTTVSFESLTAPDAATVLEQNYEYDLVSADKLLDKYHRQGSQGHLPPRRRRDGPNPHRLAAFLRFGESRVAGFGGKSRGPLPRPGH